MVSTRNLDLRSVTSILVELKRERAGSIVVQSGDGGAKPHRARQTQRGNAPATILQAFHNSAGQSSIRIMAAQDSPRKAGPRNHRRRHNADDFDERWGDEEVEADADFTESSAKRVKLSSTRSPSPPQHETPEEKAERERQRDLKDRDEFARRLAQRESEKSKKVVEARSGARDGEAARRRALADDVAARQAAMPDLRLRSRQDYLDKRAAEKLALLRKQVAEEDA